MSFLGALHFRIPMQSPKHRVLILVGVGLLLSNLKFGVHGVNYSFEDNSSIVDGLPLT